MAADHARSDAEALRALLAEQSAQAAAGAIQAGGQVSADRLDELGRLARLVDIHEAATKPGRNRWAVPTMAAATLACTSLLLFARVPSTEVEMELKVSELSFVVPVKSGITNPLDVSGLKVSGLSAVELPGEAADPAATESAASISLAATRIGRRSGTVSVDPITVPPGARVLVRKQDPGNRFWIGVRGAASRLAISANGPVLVVVPQAMNEVRDFPFPRRIDLVTDSQHLSLEFATADGAAQHDALQSPLRADSLFLYRIDRLQQADEIQVREVPTIRSGTLYFESLNGEARPLREGQGLNLAWSSGEIRQLRLGDDDVQLRFHGQVRGMTFGSGDDKRSLMPTWLDWLRARHGLWLLWGTTAYVAGLIVTLLGWWRRPA